MATYKRSDNRVSDEERGNRQVSERTLNSSFDLLASAYHRIMLRYLIDRPSETTEIDHVADRIYEAEYESNIMSTHTELLSSLHHVHLPKFVDSGAVEWKTEANTVRYLGSEPTKRVLSVIIDG